MYGKFGVMQLFSAVAVSNLPRYFHVDLSGDSPAALVGVGQSTTFVRLEKLRHLPF